MAITPGLEVVLKVYDRSLPLIVIHIPKAAGTSTREVFKRWFGSGLHEHYFNESRKKLPKRLNLEKIHSQKRPVVVYGHFNRLRGFGVEDYYPEVGQFVSILRDPFELAVSTYFYRLKIGDGWRDPAMVPKGDLAGFLRSTPPNMLNHFPRLVTRSNYREMIEEYFIEIGIMERLDESMRRIAMSLNMPFESSWLGHLNASERSESTLPLADLRSQYMQQNPLEFEVYEYVRSTFDA